MWHSHYCLIGHSPTFLNDVKEVQSYNTTFQKEIRNSHEQKRFTTNVLLLSSEFISSHAEGLSLHFTSSEDMTLYVIQVTLNNPMLLLNLVFGCSEYTTSAGKRIFEKVHSLHTSTTLEKCTFSAEPME